MLLQWSLVMRLWRWGRGRGSRGVRALVLRGAVQGEVDHLHLLTAAVVVVGRGGAALL